MRRTGRRSSGCVEAMKPSWFIRRTNASALYPISRANASDANTASKEPSFASRRSRAALPICRMERRKCRRPDASPELGTQVRKKPP